MLCWTASAQFPCLQICPIFCKTSGVIKRQQAVGSPRRKGILIQLCTCLGTYRAKTIANSMHLHTCLGTCRTKINGTLYKRMHVQVHIELRLMQNHCVHSTNPFSGTHLSITILLLVFIKNLQVSSSEGGYTLL